MIKRLALLTLIAAVAACQPDTPVSPADTVQPSLSVAGSSGCHTLRFKWDGVGFGLSFTGPLSGDLAGTLAVSFDPDGIAPFTGVTNTATYTATYNIEGGVVSQLVGRSFEVTGLNRNLLAPDNDPQLIENNGRERSLGGVEKANLTWTGFAAFTGPSEITVHLNYSGVICL